MDDLLNRLDGDATGQQLEIRIKRLNLCIQAGHPFRFTLLTVPYLHLCGEIREGHQDIQFPIQFKNLPPEDYTPVVAFTGRGEGEWGVEAKEVSTCFAWHSGWSLMVPGTLAENMRM